MFLQNLLLEATVSSWVSEGFPILRTIFISLIAVFAVIVVYLVLTTESNSGGGANAISGVRESFYSQNKGSSKEGRKKRLMVIASGGIAVLTILYAISFIFYKG